jgi:hypothetical protein
MCTIKVIRIHICFKIYFMKKIFLILSMFVFAAALPAQNVLLHKEVNDTVIKKYGPNLKNFHHMYLGFGFIAGEPDSTGSDILYGRSMNFLVGYRYKLKLTNWLALGYDVNFSSYIYRLKQSYKKIVPDSVIHDKERLSFGNLDGDIYLRLNYGRRGNRVGNFIDFGGYGDWTYAASNFTKDENKINGNIIKTTISHLNYYNHKNYGALVRLGFNRYVIYGNYRMSDIFDSWYKYPELPRFTLGLQIGIHK